MSECTRDVVRFHAVESMHPGEMWMVPVAEAPVAPFTRAFAELRAIVGPEKEADLKRWRERWIDDYAGLASVTPLEELQQFDDEARARLLTSRVEAQAYSLSRSLVTRDGVMAKEMRREPGGGTEYRLFLCVVRAEPKP